MSFTNETNGLSQKPIEKTRLIFGKDLKGAGNAQIRRILLGDENGPNIMKPLLEEGGLVMDYTPNITISHATSYTPMETTHSNYEFNAFSKANINEINIVFKSTSETLQKADKTLATIHFLRTFSKMNFGINDPLKGLPPRILKLYAYGDYLLHDLPVAIQTFAVTLSNETQYVQTSHNTQVPLSIEFMLSLRLMPTPSKVKRDFSLQSFTSGSTIKKGYI